MAKMGRPPKEINKQVFEGLCAIQCTEVEICDVFDVCEDTLNKWCKKNYKDENGKGMTFSETYAKKRNKGKSSLRRTQWKLAEKNAAMAIFLGKQYLGQRDTPEPVGNVDDEKALDTLVEAIKDAAK